MRFLRILFVACLCMPAFAVRAQPTGSTVLGVITDKVSGKPVEYANVELLNPKDSMIIKGQITDAKGKFNFDDVKAWLLPAPV
jgi:hypothetical protein